MPGSLKKKRVLITSRDPGAATNMMPVINRLQLQDAWQIAIIAQDPAATMFANQGFDVIRDVLPPVSRNDTENLSKFLSEVREKIEAFCPDIVLTGLSGPEIGVDEAALHICKNVPRFTIQDYDGWVPEGLGDRADTYFVANKQAAKITEGFGVRTVVSGLPKHEATSDLLDSIEARQNSQFKHSNFETPELCVFYGQPLGHFPGYLHTIEIFSRSLARIFPKSCLRFRPHPKEIDLTGIRKAIEATGRAFEVDKEAKTEISLLKADLAVTCFSTCLIDLLFLQSRMDALLAPGVNLLFAPDIKACFLESLNHKLPWVMSEKLTALCEREDQLEEVMLSAFDRQNRMKQMVTLNQLLEAPQKASQFIADHLLMEANKHNAPGLHS